MEVTNMSRKKQELCFEIDKDIWDAVARMKEKENIKLENIIELGITMHHNIEKSRSKEE